MSGKRDTVFRKGEMMTQTQSVLVLVGILVVVTMVFAAKKMTSWWNILPVVVFPIIGFLFVLWDVCRRGGAKKSTTAR
jgi:hypothetical protein